MKAKKKTEMGKISCRGVRTNKPQEKKPKKGIPLAMGNWRKKE